MGLQKHTRQYKKVDKANDNHFHIRNKRLTNVGAPIHNDDATTKKFVTDLLKTKASKTYLKTELGKKADKSKLSDYVLKSDLNKAISDIKDIKVSSNLYYALYKDKSVIQIKICIMHCIKINVSSKSKFVLCIIQR